MYTIYIYIYIICVYRKGSHNREKPVRLTIILNTVLLLEQPV